MFNDLDLAERLLVARRGTAYFAQRLADLDDGDLDAASLLPGWSRRHLVAHVGYNAAALCRLMEWAHTGTETPMYASADQRAREIDEGSTLTAGTLRYLVHQSAARLDGAWRGLPVAAWAAEVRTAQGRLVSASEAVWMRVREVWIHAVDLNSDGRFADFPTVVLQTLLGDIVGAWRRNDLGAGLVLAVDGGPQVAVSSDVRDSCVSGPLAAVVRWAAGRGAVGVNIDGHVHEPPRWL